MKRLLFLCVALLLLLAACGKKTDAPAEPPLLPGFTQFIVTEHRLPPPEQSFDAGFEAFYEDFTAAVYVRDMEFIDSILDDEVMTSFGGDPGKEYFHEFWSGYDIWTVLEQIAALGGVHDPANKSFTAPYTFVDFQETGLDVYGHFIVIGEGVRVFETASIVSKVIDTLDHTIVEFRYSSEFWEKHPNDFVSVTTLSGEVGYIQKKYLRAPIDYRLCIEQKDGGWRMVSLTAGD